MLIHLDHIGEMLVPTIAYGDAAGLASETLSADQIVEQFGEIKGLIPPSNRVHFPDSPVGTWSDDTQLTVAVIKSLIEVGEFDISNQAKHLIKAYDESPLVDVQGKMMPLGWGSNTTASVLRLKTGVSPQESGIEGANTNGVLMKMAPLAYWHLARGTTEELRYQQIDSLTQMTHASDEAVVSSRVHADALTYCLEAESPQFTARLFAEHIQTRALYHEQLLSADDTVSKALSYLTTSQEINEEIILSSTDRKGFIASQTLAMSYGAFLGRANYTDRVYTGVRLGGDTDSIAALAGTLSLFIDKTIVLPADITMLKDYAELCAISRKFAQVALMQNLRSS